MIVPPAPGTGAPDLGSPAARDGEKWARADSGVLSAWVADMDFPIAEPIREALVRRIDTDLGYPAWFNDPDGAPLGEVYAARMRRRFGFAPDPARVRLFTDINQAMWVIFDIASAPGSTVAVHTPACPPFLDVLETIGRRPLPIPMVSDGGRWVFDADRLRRRLDTTHRGPGGILLLVNPHNPTGRVFTRTELTELAEIVLRRDMLVLADEAHADLTYEPHRHVPFASLGDDVARRTITISSASKAFNLAGVRCAVAHIGPSWVRDALDARRGLPFGQVGVLAVEAVRAAWTDGDDWLDRTRDTLAANRRLVADLLPPEIRHHPPEATYVAWLDCRDTGLGADPVPFFERRAKVLLFSGPAFGPGGEGFARLNFGTRPAVLTEVLDRIRAAVATR